MQGPESYPYYIMTPNYTSSSLGIQVMHYLCHLLNEKGHKAWLVNAKPNPAWNTPVLSDAQFNQHNAQGIPIIAIYPEIVSGNPLKAPVVVRYMLNREGVMNGNLIESSRDDLFFWYRQEFAGKYADPLLRLELYDLELFCNDNPNKDLTLLYLNRIPESRVDFTKLPADIEILSMRNPLSLEDLAVKLKRARVLYSFESSGTNALAILCGCPVVALSIKGLEKYAVTASTLKDTGAAGYAWDDHPDSLKGVRESMGTLREKMLDRRSLANEQLVFFIAQTQRQAILKESERKKATLQGWLTSRTVPPHHPIFQLDRAEFPRFLIAVHVNKGEEEKLRQTLASIALQTQQVTVLVVGEVEPQLKMAEGQFVLKGNYLITLAAQVEQNTFDWLHNIPAGATYVAGAFATLLTFIRDTSALALCADEVWHQQGNDDIAAFRAAIDWDLYCHAPHLYLKRSVISRKGIVALGKQALRYDESYEFDLLCQLNGASGADTIVIYPDVLIQLDEPQCSQAEAIENEQVFEAYQQLKSHRQSTNDVIESLNPIEGTTDNRGPMVSVILLAGNELSLIERAITGFLQNNSWPNVEIIIVNHAHKNEALNEWIAGLATIDPETIRVLQLPIAWNPVALHNAAIEKARGQFFLFLDNQILFVMKNWLPGLMSMAIQPNVACVGPKIIGTNERIISAGVFIGPHGNAGHIGAGEHWQSSALAGRLLAVRQQRFMDGHCLLVSRESWVEAKGLDDHFMDLASAEIDMMFKMQQAGFISLWTPNSIVALDGKARSYVSLYESVNTKKLALIKLCHADIGYSARHSVEKQNFTSEEHLYSHWLADKQAGLQVVVFINVDNADLYSQRLSYLLNKLHLQRKISFLYFQEMPSLITIAKLKPKIMILSGDVSMPDAEEVEYFKKITECQLYYFISDELKSARLSRWVNYKLLDGWLVSHCKQQRWLETKKQKNIELLPMFFLQSSVTELSAALPERPRVVCDARDLSSSDRKLLTEILAITADCISWVILGDINPEWNQWIDEAHRMKSGLLAIEDIEPLHIDLAVIIRTNNEENRFKDAFLQRFYLSCGLPIFCSNVESFDNHWPAVRVKNQVAEWRRILSSSAIVWKDYEKRHTDDIKLFNEDTACSERYFEALWLRLGVTN